jgi:hypothetical protein
MRAPINTALSNPGLRTRSPEKVPPISFDIEEYRDLSIRLHARSSDKLHSRRDHSLVRSLEIIDAQKEADSPGELLASDRPLMLAVGAREQKTGRRAAGTNNYPALGPAIIRQGRNVLHELELEDVYKEINCRFVLAHHDGDKFEL